MEVLDTTLNSNSRDRGFLNGTVQTEGNINRLASISGSGIYMIVLIFSRPELAVLANEKINKAELSLIQNNSSSISKTYEVCASFRTGGNNILPASTDLSETNWGQALAVSTPDISDNANYPIVANVTDVIQEIVNSEWFATSQTFKLVIKNPTPQNQNWTFFDYGYSSGSRGPTLHIEYGEDLNVHIGISGQWVTHQPYIGQGGVWRPATAEIGS